jgi:hypothetical protein
VSEFALGVVDLSLASGFVADGRTQVQTVRIPTRRAPVFGGVGGEVRTFGGRQRFAKSGTDIKATVGRVTTCIYRLRNGKMEIVANLSTKDRDGIIAALENLERQ